MLWLYTSGLGGEHRIDGRPVAEKVGREHFDGGSGPLADGQDAAAEVVGAAIGQVVAGHGGDDDVFQPQPKRGLGDAVRARRLRERPGAPRLTEQKPHGRVQTLPRIMKVAVRRE